MRILAVSGSLRRASTNSAAIEALALLAPPEVEVIVYRELGALPHFNPDDDGDAPPAIVLSLRSLVGASDGLVIAAPEYAHGPPGALKNALDWLVASVEFPGKPAALLNTAPRARHAQAALQEILETMSARMIGDAFAPLPLTGHDIDAARIVADPALAQPLREGLARLVEAIGRDGDPPARLYDGQGSRP
jgi:chromate reductase, NAD(P)H dehydrogenase (quinone)